MQKINICYCINNDYVKVCLTSIVSLLENTKDPEKVRLFVIIDYISIKNKKHLENKVKEYGASIKIYYISTKLIKKVKILDSWNFHYSTFFRLFIAEYIDVSYKRCLYIDADTIIMKDIRDLFDINIWDNILWAVEELNPAQRIKEIIWIDCYFNAGLLLINLQKWQDFSVKDKAILYLENKWYFIYPDQDSLNIVLKDRRYHLSEKWNYLIFLPYNDLLSINILHYASSIYKPWNPIYHHSSFFVYFLYLKKTWLYSYSDMLLYKTKFFFFITLKKYLPIFWCELFYRLYRAIRHPLLFFPAFIYFVFTKKHVNK